MKLTNSRASKFVPSEMKVLVRKIQRDLGSPNSDLLVKAFESNDWDRVVTLECDPRNYDSAVAYYRDLIPVTLFKKCPNFPTTHNRREACEKKWWDGERDCFRSNARLTPYLRDYPSTKARIVEFLDDVKSIIRDWIGERPPEQNTFFHLPSGETEGYFDGWFGPGATFSDRGKLSTAADKMSSDPSVTLGAYPVAVCNLTGTLWWKALHSRDGNVEVVKGNRFATVPKTAKTDRAIAAEPSLNVYFQLAYGSMLKMLLKRNAGWDMKHAQEIHRRVACESSVSRSFCTIDLSNASDTVSRVLVELLLPRRWYEALDSLRSPRTLINGKWVLLQKFSSMGNGFTFELETVIFAAISCAIARARGRRGQLGVDVFTFGDDIIVEDDLYADVKGALEFCGFSLNMEKSFSGEVPFRESCGGDYFEGSSVRGAYLKEFPVEPQGYITAANQVNEVTKNLRALGHDGLTRTWFSLLDNLPSDIRRLRGPSSLGDIVIHDDDEGRWTVRWGFGDYKVPRRPWWNPSYTYPVNEGQGCNREVLAWVGIPLHYVKWAHFRPDVVLACAVLGVGTGDRGILPRETNLSFSMKWVACP